MSHYSLEIVSDLLSAGVVPTLRSFEEPALHASYSKPGYYRNFKEKLVEKAAEMVVEKLLALGMSVDDKDELLVYAAAAGLEMPVLLLLQAGASIHKKVRQERKGHAGNALIAAAAKGHDNLVTLLMTKYAYAYNIDYLGEALPCKKVAFLEAICYGLKYCNPFIPNPIVRVSKTVQTLIDAGADIHQGNDATLYSVMASRFSKNSSQLALAQLLLDNGANIKARDKEFNSNPDHIMKSPSMLYSAVIAGNLEIVQLALRHGADINGYGRTRTSCRTPGSRSDLDDQSISKDRVNNSFASHETVLQGALRHRDVRGDMVELLLANGADVQSLDDDEVCSLIIAARIGEPDSTDLESKRSKVLVIVDKLLEVRGVAGAVFDEAYSDDPLKRALLRFDQDESEDEGEDKRLEEIRIVMRER